MSHLDQTRYFIVELQQAPQPARVTLVGAGPGDLELLTAKAARALAAVRIVRHDHLVSKEALELIAPGAERVCVGKESAHHTLPQDAIIEAMLRLVRGGRPVLRLEGGDPCIFGRGGQCRHSDDTPRPRGAGRLRHRPPARPSCFCPASGAPRGSSRTLQGAPGRRS